MPDGYRARVLELDQPSWLLAVATLIALTAAILAVIAGGVLRMLERRPGRRWSRSMALLSGASVGLLFLQSWSDPVQGMLFVAVAGIVTVWLLWRERRVLAGLFLAAAALPWTALWGMYAVRLVDVPANAAPLATIAFFGAGLLLVLLGAVLARVGDPVPDAAGTRDPAMARPRRVGLVAEAITTPELIGSLPVSELASLLAVFAAVIGVGLLPLPDPLEPVVQVLAGTLLGSEARLHVRPARVRKAYEAFSWLGEWELDRAREANPHGVPTSPPAAERWLRDLPERPDTRWIRVEVLALLMRLDEARQVAETMPAGTAWERFERISSLDLIDWLAGSEGHPRALQAAAEEVRADGPEMHLRAEVAVAVRAVARHVAEHGPEHALGPLVEVRERLGARADGQLRRALWRRTLPISVIGAVIVTYLLSPLA